jgi:putative oxidoreductase
MFENSFLRWADKIYSFFIRIGNNLQSLFILYMRLIWGHQLFLAGIKKFFDIGQVTQMLASLNFPTPHFHAYLLATFETLCGFLIFFGLASRLAAIPMAIIMITALSTYHASVLADLKFLIHPSILVREAPYPYLLTAIIVFVFGPGKVSLDGWIKQWTKRQPTY